ARRRRRRVRAAPLRRRVARRARALAERRRMTTADLDGRIGEGWSGVKPNGSHVNVVLARRGSPTAAAAISMLAHPSPGHTPVLVCIGPEEKQYEPIWPPTLMMNKATATEERHQTITWG